MAEPDYAAWDLILRQLQSDMADVKRDLSEVKGEVTAIQDTQLEMREEVTYALGLIVTTQRDMNRAKSRIDEVVARLEKVETR